MKVTAMLMVMIVVAESARAQNNLQTCLSGKYPALCDHNALTAEQVGQVKAAENRENLITCVTGQYPALCDHNRLSREELSQVRAAEKSANLRTCLDGRFATLCDHSLLAPEQAAAVAAAEAHAAAVRASSAGPTTARPRDRGSCKSGLSIASVEGDGKIIELDDGSLWTVDDIDTVDTALWLPASEVVVCDGKMINVDDSETAAVTPIRHSGLNGTESATQSSGYAIEASANDEIFVINGEKFEAKTYCFNFERGDRVLFIEGSPFGACASAKLLNLRTKQVCEVWCE